MRTISLFCLCLTGAGSAFAAETLSSITEDAAKYEACVEMTREKPDDAFEVAITWRDEGGGSAAKHCAALALLNLGAEEEAAFRLEKIAIAPDAGGRAQRAAILSQAGNAWLLTGRTAEAEVALTSAIELTPNNARLYYERAQAHLLAGSWKKVVEDATRALALDRAFSDAYVLRATANIDLGELDKAQEDIDMAFKFDPQNVSAALQQGRLRETRKGN